MIKLPILQMDVYRDSIVEISPEIHIGWTESYNELNYYDLCSDSDDSDGSDSSSICFMDSTYTSITGVFTLNLDNDIKSTAIINQGRLSRTYIYPEIKMWFQSDMVRWWNLFYCGGWTVCGSDHKRISDDSDILNAVIAKQKPMGFLVVREEKASKFIDKILKTQLPHHSEPCKTCEGYIEISVCQHGNIRDLFNIDNFLLTYELMSDDGEKLLLSEDDQQFFNSIRDEPLSKWLKNWDYANPETNRELALTGLLLGYPIESTASIILGH